MACLLDPAGCATGALFGLMSLLRDAAFLFVPGWVWILLAALALGWAWKTFGWQGLLAAAFAALAVLAYGRGYRDGRGGRKPIVTSPLEPHEQELAAPPQPRRPRFGGGLLGRLRGRK